MNYYPPPMPRNNNLATVALVLSILGWLVPFVAVAGVVVGHVALGKIDRGEACGAGLAKVALAISYAWVAMIVAGFVILYFWVLAQPG